MTSKWWVWKQSLLQKVLSIFAERALGRGCEVLWEVSSWIQTWSGLNMVYDDFEVLGRPSRCGLIALISIKPYWILYTWFKWHKHFYQIYFQLSAWILPESSTVWKCVSKSSAKHVCLWIWWSWIIEKASEKWERGKRRLIIPVRVKGLGLSQVAVTDLMKLEPLCCVKETWRGQGVASMDVTTSGRVKQSLQVY